MFQYHVLYKHNTEVEFDSHHFLTFDRAAVSLKVKNLAKVLVCYFQYQWESMLLAQFSELHIMWQVPQYVIITAYIMYNCVSCVTVPVGVYASSPVLWASHHVAGASVRHHHSRGNYVLYLRPRVLLFTGKSAYLEQISKSYIQN